MLAQGFPPDEMCDDYGMTEEHIRVALRFAAKYVKREGSGAAWLELIYRKGPESPCFQAGDEWPLFLPFAYRSDRIKTYERVRRTDGPQDLQIQTHTHT